MLLKEGLHALCEPGVGERSSHTRAPREVRLKPASEGEQTREQEDQGDFLEAGLGTGQICKVSCERHRQ